MSSLLRAAGRRYLKVGSEPRNGAPVDPNFRHVLVNVKAKFLPHFKTKLDLPVNKLFKGKDTKEAEKLRKEGNQLFGSGKYEEALSYYNKAICLAPFPGDEKSKEPSLALAFANRSALLFRQKRYADCVRDIDAAFLLGYPPKDSGKLLTRKTKALLAAQRPDMAVAFAECIEKSTDFSLPEAAESDLVSARDKVKERRGSWPEMAPQNDTAFDKRIMAKSLAPNAGFEMGLPCSSPALEKAARAISGYPLAMTAARDIAAGEVLLVEQAFVTSLCDGTQGTNCCACRVWTDTPFPCQLCSTMVFCTFACATSENGQLHLKECRIWESLPVQIDTNRGRYLLMAMRTILKLTMDEWRRLMPVLTSSEPNPDIKLPRGLQELFTMPFAASEDWCNSGTPGKTDLDNVVKSISVLCDVVVNPDPDFMAFLAALLTMQLLNFGQNRVPMVDSVGIRELLHTGDGIFPAFTSHFIPSCDPNTVFCYHSDYLAVRASKPIKKGDSISRACGISYKAKAKVDRDLFYMKSALGNCRCSACLGDWPNAGVLFFSKTRVKCPKCDTLNLLSLLDDRRKTFCRKKGCRQCFDEFFVSDLPDAAGLEVFDRVGKIWSLADEPSAILLEWEVCVGLICLESGNTRLQEFDPDDAIFQLPHDVSPFFCFS